MTGHGGLTLTGGHGESRQGAESSWKPLNKFGYELPALDRINLIYIRTKNIPTERCPEFVGRISRRQQRIEPRQADARLRHVDRIEDLASRQHPREAAQVEVDSAFGGPGPGRRRHGDQAEQQESGAHAGDLPARRYRVLAGGIFVKDRAADKTPEEPMNAPLYHLVIRARPDARFEPDPGMLAERLERIPGVSIEGPRRFTFGEADEHGQMEILAPENGEIGIRIPRPWVMEKGPQVFALVFMAAEWCGGEVFDPQIDDTLRKDVVLQGLVAARQAQRERDAAPPAMPAPTKAPTTDESPAPPKRPWWKPGP